MSSVAKIEALIQKLSVADQRVIARHLDARLAEEEGPAWRSTANEGIPFLAQDGFCPEREEPRRRKFGPHALNITIPQYRRQA